MATTYTAISRTAPRSWKYQWSGTSPFYVYRDGGNVFGIGTTTQTSWIFEGQDDKEPPVVEVIDSTESTSIIEQLNNPPFAILQWREATGAAYYVVQQYDTSNGAGFWRSWVTVNENGRGYYNYRTAVLDDVTTASWRIAAYDLAGGVTYITFSMFVCRNPEPPSIDISYNAGTGLLTVSAR